MPIETTCPGCSRRLRVAEEHAGKTARCPACQALYTVPANPQAAAADAAPASPRPTPASNNPFPDSGDVQFPSPATGFPPPNHAGSAGGQATGSGRWRLKTEDGSVYGPVDRFEMDNWVAQGRVSPDAELQQEGESFWRRASTVYPELNLSPTAAPSTNPFSDQHPATSANPYAVSAAGPYGVRGRRYREAHRGGLILALGLISLFGCSLLGPVALILGFIDLQKMSNGTMDPSGKGLTIAGMVIAGLILLLTIAMVIFSIAAEM